jgi:hypothetical protein
MTARLAARYQSPAPASPGEAGDRNPQERRSKPRFLHMFKMRKAGQAAGQLSSRESGIKGLGHFRFCRGRAEEGEKKGREGGKHSNLTKI